MAVEISSPFQHLDTIARATGKTFNELEDGERRIVIGSYPSIGELPGFVQVSFFEGTDTKGTPPKSSFIVTPDGVGRLFGHDLERPYVADIVANRVDKAWRRTHPVE